MKHKPKFFVLENSQIHSYFGSGNIETTQSKKLIISKTHIEVDSGVYPLYSSIEEAMESIKDTLIGKYVFVDDDGVIHNISKDGTGSTYLADLGILQARFEDVVDDGFPSYKAVIFSDPNGMIDDKGDHVVWEPLQLAKELDQYYS